MDFDFQQFFTKLCIYELSHWNLLTCKQRSLYFKSTDTKTWFSLKYVSDMKQIAIGLPFCNYNRGGIVCVLQTQTPFKVYT
jgi:hypothetical protein